MSKLDYGNSVLIGLPIHLIGRLQSVQNAAARLMCKLRRFDHIADALVSLHWLRISERIVYKIALLIFKVLPGITPEYLGPVVRVANLPGRQDVRSPSTNHLVVPPFKLLNFPQLAVEHSLWLVLNIGIVCQEISPRHPRC